MGFQIFTELQKRSKIFVIGIWLAYSTFASLFILYPILFTAPKFNKKGNARDDAKIENPQTSLIEFCQNSSNYVINEEDSTKSLAYEYSLYCEKRYIADAIISLASIGAILGGIFNLYIEIPNSRKIRAIKILIISYGISFLAMAALKNIVVISFGILTVSFCYIQLISQITEYMSVNAPAYSQKFISTYNFIFFSLGSIVYLTISNYLGSSWRAYFTIIGVISLLSSYLISKGDLENEPLDYVNIEDELTGCTEQCMSRIDQFNEEKILQQDYIWNAVILILGGSLINGIIMFILIEMSDSNDNLYFSLIVYLALEVSGSSIGAALLHKYNSAQALKISLSLVSIPCIAYLMYNGNNFKDYILLSYLTLFLVNIANNILFSSIAGHLPPKEFNKFYTIIIISLRFIGAFYPQIFTLFKFKLHLHIIGVTGLIVLLFIRSVKFLKKEEARSIYFFSEIRYSSVHL